MKYLFFFLSICLAVAVHAQSTNDSVAIIKVLQKESATWRSGDIEAHASCWHIQPYSKILVSTTDGKSFVVPPALMVHPSPGSVGKGGSSANTNYLMSIHGNDAWVSHDETSTSADGTKSYSHEIRILEKINGEWKLVAQSIHLFKPE